MKRSVFQRIQIWFVDALSKVHWRQTSTLTKEDLADLQQKFAKDYYIILTRRRNHLTTFFINLGNFFLTGKWGFYSHVLMNLEDEVINDVDFKFIEATGKGTHYSTFKEVFDGVDAVALVTPKNMTLDEWTAALDKAKSFLGRPYDDLFDLKSDLEINCVELVYLALKGIPNFQQKFPNLEALAMKKGKLTPSMFIDCPDFVVNEQVKRLLKRPD